MRAELDAATSTSADTHEAQWRAGVNRQAQPAAASHQQAASRAAAAKRTATAMAGEEKAAADRRRADRRNEAKRARRTEAKEAEAAADVAAQVAAVIDDVIEQVELDAVNDAEWEAFEDWLEAQGRDDATLNALCDWRMSHEYEVWHAEDVAAQWRIDDEQYEALLAREAKAEARREAQRQLELEHGAPFEWAQRVERERWVLLSRERLAGQRSRYAKLRPFAGSVSEAELHVGWDMKEGYATAEDDAEEDMAAEERAERKARRQSARAWMREQRSVLQHEVESQLRWDEVQPERGPGGVLACFVRMVEADDAGVSRTAVHYGHPSGGGALHGGTAVAAPVVRGGIHEFTFTVEAIPDKAPCIGLCGERERAGGGTAAWKCQLDLSNGHVYYDGDDIGEQGILADLSCVSAGCTVTVRIHFEQRRLGFAFDSAQLTWIDRGPLAYVGNGFAPLTARPCASFHAMFADHIPMPLADGTAITLSSHACLLAASDVIAVVPSSSCPALIMGIDPVGDVPYYYMENDAARRLAREYGCLDPGAEDWMDVAPSHTAASIAPPQPRHHQPLPKRSQFPHGGDGRKRFRAEREQWLSDRGIETGSSAQEHHSAFHSNTRNFRTRNT